MDPWTTEYTKLVSGLNNKALSTVDIGPVIAAFGFVVSGTLGFRLSCIGRAPFNVFEFAAEGVTMSFS